MATGLLLTGCGASSAPPGDHAPAMAPRPDPTPSSIAPNRLWAGQVADVLPDEAALRGWTPLIEPFASGNQDDCPAQWWKACLDVVALGTVAFSRGEETQADWAGVDFRVFSVSDESTAHRLYTDLRPAGATLGPREDRYTGFRAKNKKLDVPDPVGDEQDAWRQTLTVNSPEDVTVISMKARTGTTVLVVNATSFTKNASQLRAQAALTMLVRRVEQVKGGAEPTAGVTIN